MVLDKRTREQLLAHCGELQEDDGVDPRDFFKVGRRSGGTNRKTQQLCRQVAETLHQVFSGELGDEILQLVSVVGVAPAPDSSRLLVTVEFGGPVEQFDARLVERRLASCQSRLRREVAAAITRRKTPALVFAIQPPTAGGCGGEEARP